MLPPELWAPLAWDEYLTQLTAPPAQPATQLPASHTPQPPTLATCLNQPITAAEIEVALQRLHNGRSGPLLGYTSELLRYAKLVPTDADPAPEHLLLPCLQMLFNTAFSLGTVPQSWKTSLVTPIFKRGDATDTANYQLRWASLLVGCMLASWFSAWSNTQSSKVSDPPPRQATGQSTAPSIRHLCCSTSSTSTDASSLHCILQTPSTGLRQGWPLNATLFGLFIDGLHHYLATAVPMAGIQILQMRLRELVYADDICLLARTTAGPD